jgi:hydrogenase expression/formation protein HypC
MCLAVPLEILKLQEDGKALVRQGREGELEVDVSLLDDPKVGDFVLVHAGFAIDMVDLEEAQRRISMLQEIQVDAAG